MRGAGPQFNLLSLEGMVAPRGWVPMAGGQGPGEGPVLAGAQGGALLGPLCPEP